MNKPSCYSKYLKDKACKVCRVKKFCKYDKLNYYIQKLKEHTNPHIRRFYKDKLKELKENNEKN